MERLPTEDKVKRVIFSLNGDSSSGPDGFSGQFFQSCWNIIGEDITNMVRAFFCGQELPRYITHTNLALILKKESIGTFGDLRPISLSTFANKIISKVVQEKMVIILPEIISTNQTSFVRGRSITENVLLAREIIRDIHRRDKLHNVVVKLGMAKAYDRVSWKYLLKVLRCFGFSERIINVVLRLISNNWYSMLVNGQSFGFFQSSRGLKQGDPLSPTLFIIAAEVLSMSLNKLFEDQVFRGYVLGFCPDFLTII
uniref:RNA-directed DNA polymerase (Reverse transcriptase) n=1 Tax=Solanum tuberosum TaxID=4113 RepID=M0ZKY9_SOLTU